MAGLGPLRGRDNEAIVSGFAGGCRQVDAQWPPSDDCGAVATDVRGARPHSAVTLHLD